MRTLVRLATAIFRSSGDARFGPNFTGEHAADAAPPAGSVRVDLSDDDCDTRRRVGRRFGWSPSLLPQLRQCRSPSRGGWDSFRVGSGRVGQVTSGARLSRSASEAEEIFRRPRGGPPATGGAEASVLPALVNRGAVSLLRSSAVTAGSWGVSGTEASVLRALVRRGFISSSQIKRQELLARSRTCPWVNHPLGLLPLVNQFILCQGSAERHSKSTDKNCAWSDVGFCA